MAEPALSVTTELDAVNTMLQGISADPVSSLTVSVDSDVTIARGILKETLREVQSQGWDFNTDKRYSLARTVDNEYVIPSNVASCDVSDDFPYIRATQRNGKMWDQIKHTFTWDVDLTFNIVWFFEFAELPQTARHYITMKSARKFQARVLGSTTLGQFTEKDELDAQAIFKDAEGMDAEHNILTGNNDVYRVINRRV